MRSLTHDVTWLRLLRSRATGSPPRREVHRAHKHPHESRQLGLPAQTPPDIEAHRRADQRHKRLSQPAVASADVIVMERRCVYTQECQERTEVEQFAT